MILTEYVRDQHGHKRGMVVAADRGLIGWSKCHKTDEFDRDLAYRIAIGRAINGSKSKIPSDVVYYVTKMEDRANRYFK